ncbi:MAG: hypothetical protein WBG37_02700 [Desulfobacterales bacterium]
MKKWILRIGMVALIAGGIGLFVIMDRTNEYDFGISALGGRQAEADGKSNDGWGLPIFMR